MPSGLGIWVLTRRPFLGNLPLSRGSQEFTSPGALSYNWLEKNVVEACESKIGNSDPIPSFAKGQT